MEILMYILAMYLVIVNIAGFATMGIDKRRAINHAWRIKEATLFGVALIGGGIGSTIGMHVFRHKTKHWYFVLGMPAIAVLNVVCAVLILRILLSV